MSASDSSLSSREKLLGFVDREVLHEIMEAFTNTTGLMANVVDTEGVSIFSRKSLSKCCKFCQLIYSTDGGLQRCRGAYKRAGKQAALFQEPYIFRCPAGLVEWAAPIIVDGEHLGSLICGQVLMWEPEEFFWIELREMNKVLFSDFTELFKAVEELPIVSPSKVRSASYLMYMVANYIAKAGWEQHIHAKEIAYQQHLLNNEIKSRKTLEERLTSQVIPYDMAIETDLSMKIKLGETEHAQKIMLELIENILASEQSRLFAVQTRMVELSVIMARSALSTGADKEDSKIQCGHTIRSILAETSARGACMQGAKLLDYYLSEINELKKAPQNTKVLEIKRFIRKHYGEDLTLNSIASAVFLSPTYASRLFKSVEKCSIMEYVTLIRVEEAKQLLKDPHILIDTVAQKAGYADASYFTKVFRRVEGITPTQYRKTCASET